MKVNMFCFWKHKNAKHFLLFYAVMSLMENSFRVVQSKQMINYPQIFQNKHLFLCDKYVIYKIQTSLFL